MNKRTKRAGKSTTASKHALRHGKMETSSEYEKTSSYGKTSRSRSTAGKTSRARNCNG